MNKSISLALALVALSGCAERAPYFESKFGEAARMTRAQQIINPDASLNRDPVKGMDGKAADSTIDRYRKSFEVPPAPVNVFTIGVGGGK